MKIKLLNFNSFETYDMYCYGKFEPSESVSDFEQIDDDTEFFDENNRKFPVNDIMHKIDKESNPTVEIEFMDCEGDYNYMSLDLTNKIWKIIK